MKITREDVLRVAELAHLELNESEIDTFSRQLDSILSYSEKLNEVDTAHIEPMAYVSQAGDPSEFAGTPLREDVPQPCTVVDEVLSGAPDPKPPYFRVPKVIER